VIRLIPPLIITQSEVDTALTILEEVFQKDKEKIKTPPLIEAISAI